MIYSVTLDRQVTVNYANCPYLPALLAMSVASTAGFVDPGVFVYRIDPDTGAQTFSHVASPCDLDTYVYNGSPDAGFVRRSTMSKTYPTAVTADTGIAEIEAAVQSLCNLMEKITDLSAPTQVVISS